MARKHLTRTVLAVVGLLIAIPAAQATYAVIDTAALGKLTDQINQMKEQLATQLEQLTKLKESVSFLNDISSFTKEVQDAVGKVGSISLPIPNLQKMAAQTKSDLRCLMPENGLKWGIKIEDLNLGSICETSAKYRQALFFDPEASQGQTYAEMERARAATVGRRTALLEDNTARGLAQADIHLMQADELNEAAGKLQADLNSAKTMQDREHVSAQIALAQTRALVRQNQLLAQLVRIQAALAISIGLPADRVAEITQEAAGK